MADLGSKQIAFAALAAHGAPVPLVGHTLRLAAVLNDQSAFGVSLGPYTWEINVVLTFLGLVLSVVLCPALAVIDCWAPIMLGLIAGAATGNVVSLFASPGGVPDFIAVNTGHGHELVFNLADVAAIAGVVLLARTAALVTRAVVHSRGR
jgi:lipoprotein signal peptidase